MNGTYLWSYYAVSLLFLQVLSKRRHERINYALRPQLDGFIRCPERPTNWKNQFGRKRCRKSCTGDHQCGNGRKRCLCDGECGWSCINPASRCSAVVDLTNGYTRLPRDFVFNSMAEFGCDPGFVLQGNPIRRCQGDRHWSGKNPICRLKASDCGPPRELPYAEHDAPLTQTSFSLDSLLHYTCAPGYFAIKGLPKSKCLLYNGTARWFGPDNDFKCSARSCGNPGDLLNGIRQGEIFEYPHTVKYMCVGGFELLGSAIRKCQANGKWSGDKPFCKPVRCPKPDEPLHGNVVGTSLDYQSRITYTCKDGYRLVGQAQRVCQADKTWIGQEPICQEIKCPPLGPLWNGYLQGDDTSFETVVMFRCLEGMSQLGAPYTKCLRDGTWSHQEMPKCMAPCPIPRIEHGRVARWNSSQLVQHGERVQVECDDNHEAGYPEYPLCHNGTWSHIPRCIPVRCKTWPPKVRDSRVIFSKSVHNSAARYECHPGFELKGNSIIHCMFGQWTIPLPTCQEKICPHPSEVMGSLFHGGSILLHGTMGAYKYAEYIRSVTEGRQIVFECNPGYKLYEYCPHPKIQLKGLLDNGYIKLESIIGAFEYTDYIKYIGQRRAIVYECMEGYLLQGPPRATCVDGVWSPGVKPRCIPKTHPVLEGKIVWNTAAAKLRRRRKREILATKTRQTRNDIHKRRRKHRRKQAILDESFNVQKRLKMRNRQVEFMGDIASDQFLAPTDIYAPEGDLGIKFKHCAVLYDNVRQSFAVIKQELVGEGVGFGGGSQLMVLCKPGFILPDNEDGSIECVGGEWYPSVPECNPKSCILPDRENSYYTFQSQITQPGMKIRHGEGARLNCLQHYTIFGNQDAECYLGRFIKTLGQCIPNKCQLPFIRHGFYELSSFPNKVSHGSEIRFTCQKDLHPSPSSSFVKCDHGFLRPHEPECNPEKSGPPPPETPFGCPRPANIDQAWVYRHQMIRDRIIARMIDPYQDVYPNNTLVHYKCTSDNFNHDNQNHQAVAVKCIDGEWISQLHFSCANASRPPPGVNSDSGHIRRLQVEGSNPSCDQPNLLANAFISEPYNRTLLHFYGANGFPHSTKLQVSCRSESRETSRVWRIKCKKGEWKDLDHIKCDDHMAPFTQQNHLVAPFGACLLSPIKYPKVRFFWKNKGTVLKVAEHLPDGAEVEARCDHVGMYQFSGSKQFQCRKGKWNADFPICYQLNAFANISRPPGVLYRVKSGVLAETNTGVLVVRRSSDLLLECLYPKEAGQPKWETTTTYRAYPQSWKQVTLSLPWTTSSEPVKVDSYRLTVDMIQFADSGIYYCIAPSGHRQTVFVMVKDIKCSSSIIVPAKDQGIKMEISGAKGDDGPFYMGSSLKFSCPEGYELIGESTIYCLETETWSQKPPTCQPIHCPPLHVGHPALSMQVTGTIFDSAAKFTCSAGYAVSGPSHLHCTNNGIWSDPVPTCVVVTCPSPDLPAGLSIKQPEGLLSSKPKLNYSHGDVIIFSCEPGKMMAGRDFVVCDEHGKWDNPSPECLPYCRYPGRPTHGDSTVAQKDYYLVGERLVYYCISEEYLLNGNNVLECMNSGLWDKKLPICKYKYANETDANFQFLDDNF